MVKLIRITISLTILQILQLQNFTVWPCERPISSARGTATCNNNQEAEGYSYAGILPFWFLSSELALLHPFFGFVSFLISSLKLLTNKVMNLKLCISA